MATAEAASVAVPEMPPGRCRVAVVGGGVAGLAAARHLRRAGLEEVVVVEARDRLGGRICTVRLGDCTAVDMGAAWLHGHSGANPLAAIAETTGAALVATDWGGGCLRYPSRGSAQGPPETCREPLAEADFAAARRAFDMSWQLHKQQQAGRRQSWPKEADEGLWSAVERLKSKRFEGVAALPEGTRRLLRHLWLEETEFDYAASPEDMSATWWDVDGLFPGPDCLWKEGYCQVVDHLAEECRGAHGGGLVLAAEVAEIRSRAEGAGGDQEGRHEVVMADGHVLVCDAVVCTLPLGVLKSGRVAFHPPLSPTREAAINRVGVGLLNKVVLRFDGPVFNGLPHVGVGEDFVTGAGDPAGPAGTSAQGQEPHALIRVALSDGRRDPEATEAPYVVNLRLVTGSPTLVAYLCAGAAKRMERLPDEEIADRILGQLRASLPEAFARARLLECRVSRWSADPHALGSYSYLPVGASSADRRELARPRACGRVFFAGEATEESYPATVHGALLSGVRAAREVLSALGIAAAGRRRGGGHNSHRPARV